MSFGSHDVRGINHVARKSILFQKQKEDIRRVFFFFSKEIEYVLRKVEDLFYNTNISIQTKATNENQQASRRWHVPPVLEKSHWIFFGAKETVLLRKLLLPFSSTPRGRKVRAGRVKRIRHRWTDGSWWCSYSTNKKERERERIRRRDEGKRGERDEKRDEWGRGGMVDVGWGLSLIVKRV